MITPQEAIRPERPDDEPAIAALQRAAFGPGAYARAAFRVREQAPHDPALSYVSEVDGRLVGSVRLTPIEVGSARGYLLGPLVVDPAFKNLGYGKALVRHVLACARRGGERFVLLVGDEPYYGLFGFRRVPGGGVLMPGPADPARILVAELVPGAADGLAGTVRGAVRPPAPACAEASAPGWAGGHGATGSGRGAAGDLVLPR
ncbi:GNAT family N-acetyltransferase [Propylenella binzhouense]|uniref:N-acetyltransferase n=1 Tax=Propylenella binzhouense TaxID=2555902 RepID=A0A964T1R1_9HYPH|nr:N-acetyltransferase [Propylenella binzhouense]MYZ46725.1 N-acetyltransferase [Propylenella binzhouense]